MLNPVDEYRRATELEQALREAAEQAAANRGQALAELHRRGWSYRTIATEVGISHSRVAQLVRSADVV